MGAAGGERIAGRAGGALIRAAYLAAAGFEGVLAEELARRGAAVSAWHGGLALSPDAAVAAAWAVNTWLEVCEAEVASVGAAAGVLRGVQRNWGAYEVAGLRRRMALVTARLPPLKPKLLVFPGVVPAGHLGAWSLLTPERMIYSARQSSAFVNGAVGFVEDRAGPPSRAYLKLWEGLTLLGEWPGPGEVCYDLGAAPGGWTWVLAGLGARVVAVDKAELDAGVLAMPGVEMRRESAFGISPAGVDVDWVFSDVIAYPARLLGLVQGWIDAGRVRRIVCTLKFQGATDHASAEAFAGIPGGWVRHLYCNKHELTFFWRRP